MRKLVILYKILFLLVGNVLFSAAHLMHHHDHDHDHEILECEECITIENSNNYTLNSQEIFFENNSSRKFILEQFTTIFLDTSTQFLSRAPPFSN